MLKNKVKRNFVELEVLQHTQMIHKDQQNQSSHTVEANEYIDIENCASTIRGDQ